MSYTGATSGYSAGEQANTSKLDYALETTFNTAPADAYQRLRFTGESLAVQDGTSTPDEINDNPENAETVLVSRSTKGSISGALSFGTYDDLLAGVLGSDWQTVTKTVGTESYTGVSNDASLGIKYDTVLIKEAWMSTIPTGGQVEITDGSFHVILPYAIYVRAVGPTLLLPLNSLASKTGNGTVFYNPSSTATFAFSGISNGKLGKFFTFRKALASKWQQFTGCLINQVQISLQQGQTPTIQMDVIGSDMALATVDVSTSVTAATTSPIMDVVNGFLGCTIFGSTPAGCIRSATITLSRNGSGQDTGMGHVGACGIQPGSFQAAMEIQYFFKDYTEFQAWQSGLKGIVSVSVKGSDGNGYRFSLLNGRIFNPTNPISQKNATLVATVSVTGNPITGGGTFSIARIKG